MSPEAARFYADVYLEARSTCCRDLRRIGCSDEEAEDIFMATCEHVMSTVDPIARKFEPKQMVAVLRISAKRRMIDERRHEAVLRHVGLEVAGPVSDEMAATPDEVVEDHEIVAIGREAVSTLTPRDRRIFWLRHEFELTPTEVRRQVPGLSPRAYRRRIEHGNVKVGQAFDDISCGRRCTEIRRRKMRRHAHGLTSGWDAEEVELHLVHCLPCRRYFGALRRLRHLRTTKHTS